VVTATTTSMMKITLLSADRHHIMNSGDSVALDCRFHAVNYNLFDYPVLWRKRQLDEDVQINVMGNINEPFLAGHRFEATFTSSSSSNDAAGPDHTYSLQLSISGQFDRKHILSSFVKHVRQT